MFAKYRKREGLFRKKNVSSIFFPGQLNSGPDGIKTF